MDFCNLVLAGQPACHLNRVQSVLEAAAHVITGTWKYDHITPHLRNHWLPVPQRVDYKLCLTVYKALNGLAPLYLFCLCTLIASLQSHHMLRSAVTENLVIPQTNMDFVKWKLHLKQLTSSFQVKSSYCHV